MRLNPLQRRRLANFRANRRAFWSLWIFLVLFVVTLCAEFVANDRPLLVRFRGELFSPVIGFYTEADFGGEFRIGASSSYGMKTSAFQPVTAAPDRFSPPTATVAFRIFRLPS